MMESEVTSPPGPVPVVLVVTVTVEEAVIVPVNPCMVAVIWIVPGPVEVTNPPPLPEVTVATSFEPVLQVTKFVTS
jgi:hypothetical protein